MVYFKTKMFHIILLHALLYSASVYCVCFFMFFCTGFNYAVMKAMNINLISHQITSSNIHLYRDANYPLCSFIKLMLFYKQVNGISQKQHFSHTIMHNTMIVFLHAVLIAEHYATYIQCRAKSIKGQPKVRIKMKYTQLHKGYIYSNISQCLPSGVNRIIVYCNTFDGSFICLLMLLMFLWSSHTSDSHSTLKAYDGSRI